MRDRTRFIVDGQREPKSEPLELRLRDPDILQLPQPLTFELSMSAFYEAGGWIETVPGGLP